MTFQMTPKSHCSRASATNVSLRICCDYAYRSPIALLETLHCLYGDPTSFLLNVYANAELRRTLILCACSNCATSHGVLDDPTATNKDTVALLRRYKRLYLRISEERSRIIDLGSEMTVCARNQTTVHTSSTL